MWLCDVQKRWMECSVEESKNAGCWMNGRGQGAEVNYCAWQMRIYELWQKGVEVMANSDW